MGRSSSMARLPVTKTPKVYVGGQFIRSESGRVFPVREAGGGRREPGLIGNIPQCTRKDLRNAVEAAAKAGPGWAQRTPYNRGQILYRLAEMLESRAEEMAEALMVSGAASKGNARREVAASVDRLIYYSGWADKYEQVLGNTNPVAGPFFNFTVAEPMGIVGIVADDAAPLLGLISQIAPVIVAGNTCVCLASQEFPYPAIVLGELLAVRARGRPGARARAGDEPPRRRQGRRGRPPGRQPRDRARPLGARGDRRRRARQRPPGPAPR